VELFSDRLKMLVCQTGKSQKAVSGEIGISDAALCNYLNGRLPKADELLRISRHFGRSIEWLLTGEGDQYKPSHPQAQSGVVRDAPASDYSYNILPPEVAACARKIAQLAPSQFHIVRQLVDNLASISSPEERLADRIYRDVVSEVSAQTPLPPTAEPPSPIDRLKTSPLAQRPRPNPSHVQP
jgi:transcriptional regulator with XRE-family HTH domain